MEVRIEQTSKKAVNESRKRNKGQVHFFVRVITPFYEYLCQIEPMEPLHDCALPFCPSWNTLIIAQISEIVKSFLEKKLFVKQIIPPKKEAHASFLKDTHRIV